MDTNIIIKKKNKETNEYDKLYPKTLASNVNYDKDNNIYDIINKLTDRIDKLEHNFNNKSIEKFNIILENEIDRFSLNKNIDINKDLLLVFQNTVYIDNQVYDIIDNKIVSKLGNWDSGTNFYIILFKNVK